MKKTMEKAIEKINKAIDEREVTDFIEEFWDGAETYYFVKECVTENKLDVEKMKDFSDEQQKDYIYNILVFWYGMPMEKAAGICK